MRTLKNSDGFSPIHALLILVIVGIVGFTGWYVWSANEEAAENYDTKSSSVDTESDKTTSTLSKTYLDSVGKFSINYPANWKLVMTKDASDADNAWSDAKLTSPTGTILSLRSNFGGKGGMCEPEDGDEPFAAGNACSTNEYLSSDTLPIKNVFYPEDAKDTNGTFMSSYKQSNIVLVTAHYADNDGKSQYTIGVTDSDPRFPVYVNKPTMGMVVPEHFVTVYDASGKFHPYIYATASGEDKSFLTSNDAVTVKAILRTLKIDV